MITILLATDDAKLNVFGAIQHLEKALEDQGIHELSLNNAHILNIATTNICIVQLVSERNIGISVTLSDDVVVNTEVSRICDGIEWSKNIKNNRYTVKYVLDTEVEAWHQRLVTLSTIYTKYNEIMANLDLELPGTILFIGEDSATSESLIANGYRIMTEVPVGLTVYMLDKPNSRVSAYASREYIGFHSPKIPGRLLHLMRQVSSCPDFWDCSRWELEQESGYFITELSKREARTCIYSTLALLECKTA